MSDKKVTLETSYELGEMRGGQIYLDVKNTDGMIRSVELYRIGEEGDTLKNWNINLSDKTVLRKLRDALNELNLD